jgi:hypothetical protein
MYFDGPTVFTAKDRVGTQYLCTLYDRSERAEMFICTPLSKERLASLLLGVVDVREIYVHPEIVKYFVTNLSDNESADISLVLLDEAPDPSWFPDSGLTFPQNVEEHERSLIDSAAVQGTAVIRLSLNPPEARRDHSIDTIKLAEALQLFSRLVKANSRQHIKSLSHRVRSLLRDPGFSETEVLAFSENSFDILLRAKQPADLFSSLDIVDGLKRLDSIVSVISSPEQSLTMLKENQGHVAKYYVKLLEYVIQNDSPLHYAWTTPFTQAVHTGSIDKPSALSLIDKVSSKVELFIEELEISGRLRAADEKTGTWLIESTDDGRIYRGRLLPEANISLEGLIIGSQYTFTCQESTEENEATGSERTTIFLIGYHSATT